MAGGINLYAYAGNNPVSFSDPFGLCKEAERGNATQAGICASDYKVRVAESRRQYHISALELGVGLGGLGKGRTALKARAKAYDAQAQVVADVTRSWPQEPTDATRGDLLNAARHQVWQCEMIQGGTGEPYATMVGDAHEGSERSNDSRADQSNNKKGRATGETAAPGTCTQAVVENLRQGNYSRPRDFEY